jgi:hypothetical protein
MEAMLMGVPGPLRAEISFAAGLRFSVGRPHRLSLLRDDQGVVKSRVAGRQMQYVDPETVGEPPTSISTTGTDGRTAGFEWLSFVGRHWNSADTVGLADRTSRDFPDVGEGGRERIGRIYNHIDSIPGTDTASLLSITDRYLSGPENGVETDIAIELIVEAQRAVFERLNSMPWGEAKQHWHALVQLWQQSDEGRVFAEPMIENALRVAGAEHPITAAAAALDLARALPYAAAGGKVAVESGHAAILESALTHLAEWADRAPDTELEKLPDLCAQWRLVRPACPILERIRQRCSEVNVSS